MMGITIRQLMVDDWEVLRSIRLLALKSDPSVFGRTYAEEVNNTPQDWQETLADINRAMFGVYDGEELVGLTGVKADRHDETGKTAKFFASWLRKDYRGKGLSRLMYEARLAWVRKNTSFERIVVSHRASNAASKAANQKYGFILIHKKMDIWPDGVNEEHLYYQLQIKPAAEA